MHDETKSVTIDEANYQLRRMTPAVGSYIWQLLMKAVYKSQEGQKEDVTQPAPLPDAMKPSNEERLRGMCGVAFMFLGFDDFQFVQRNCMLKLSREEATAGYLPVMADDGRWANKELEQNPFLVTRLMVEVLAFNLSSFLA